MATIVPFKIPYNDANRYELPITGQVNSVTLLSGSIAGATRRWKQDLFKLEFQDGAVNGTDYVCGTTIFSSDTPYAWMRPSVFASLVGSTIVLSSYAVDVDGTDEHMDFYVNDTLVGSSTDRPYTMQWKPKAAGIYRVYAKVVGGNGKVYTTLAKKVNIVNEGGVLTDPNVQLVRGAQLLKSDYANPDSFFSIDANGVITLIGEANYGLSVGYTVTLTAGQRLSISGDIIESNATIYNVISFSMRRVNGPYPQNKYLQKTGYFDLELGTADIDGTYQIGLIQGYRATNTRISNLKISVVI